MQISVYQNNGERRVIGTLEGGVFTKKVKESKHLFRKMDAWGVDAAVFTHTLMSPQCSVILLKDTETGKQYMTTPDIMKKRGEYRHYKPYRAQIFLSRRYWATDKDILSAARIKEILREDHIGV